MKGLFKHRYTNLFWGGLIALVLVALWMRPLNSPWHPFIAGDGLGYYAYLPAKFIHNDPQLDFKWFNRVYNANYVYSSFENPEDNLLVQYGDKKINKYYQGLSYIWFPFFAAGHVCAKVLHYTPDGFSRPYQVFIGIGSLFYILLGLFFLNRLLLALFKNPLAATTVPFFIFFGTPLFTYAVFANTLSHSYSFTFICGFLYFLQRFLYEPRQKSLNLILLSFFFIITICIRPLSGIVLFMVPAFLPPGFWKGRTVFERIRLPHILVMVIALGALCWQLWLTWIQTGSVLAYTYTDERFIFTDNRFFDALWSYHMGLLWYVPLVFFSLVCAFFIQRRLGLILLLFFLGLIFLYSSWWYWNIVKRAIIDFYAIPAIFLAGVLSRVSNKRTKLVLLGIMAFMTLFFQFKYMQQRYGILDEFMTHRELYWRHFFRTQKANIFPVPPQSILSQEKHREDFETKKDSLNISPEQAAQGKSALLLDKDNYIVSLGPYNYPKFYYTQQRKKIRLSFQLYATAPLPAVHAFLVFKDAKGNKVSEVPFYVNEDHIFPGEWDQKEFGYDVMDEKLFSPQNIATVEVMIWNVNPREKLFVDDLELDFLVTDNRFETIK